MVINTNTSTMGDDENRSKLFNEIKNFSQRKLRKVETKVTTGSGEQVTEKRGNKGLLTVKTGPANGPGYVVDHKPDLQVGMIIPGLFIGKFILCFVISKLNQLILQHIWDHDDNWPMSLCSILGLAYAWKTIFRFILVWFQAEAHMRVKATVDLWRFFFAQFYTYL